MYRDPHIRSYRDAPPLVPGSLERFRWPVPGDPEVRKLREGVQDHGRGLYVLRAPYEGGKVIVEAHYPEDMRPVYVQDWLDPFRRADYKRGLLVVVRVFTDIKPSDDRLRGIHLAEIRRNNRRARRDLRRQAGSHARNLEIEDRIAKDEQPVFDRFEDFMHQVKVDTYKYAIRPHVGPARSLHTGN